MSEWWYLLQLREYQTDDQRQTPPSTSDWCHTQCSTLHFVETHASNAIDVIVLDSVAALVTKQELDGEIGDSTVGAQARLMSSREPPASPALSPTHRLADASSPSDQP